MFLKRKRIYPIKGYQRSEYLYQLFLLENKKYFPKDFFDMFRYDFFHDALLKQLRYNYRKKTVTLKLDNPNFTDNDGFFHNCEFNVQFEDVSYFRLGHLSCKV